MIANFSEIRQNSRISRGNIGKISLHHIVLLSAKFRAVRRTVVANIRLVQTKIQLKTKVQCCSSTFDDLLMRGRIKETEGQRLKNNNYN